MARLVEETILLYDNVGVDWKRHRGKFYEAGMYLDEYYSKQRTELQEHETL